MTAFNLVDAVMVGEKPSFPVVVEFELIGEDKVEELPFAEEARPLPLRPVSC